ncbi:hypothetical protein HDU76_000717 [Blyttiomyces sp. JEL0837]|nr:hypothetical protein HDU76_000717 [Blyttiomyces sp. JEL0837]
MPVHASSWTFDNIPQLDGKVFIVTGGNMGRGRVTSTELARKGAHVLESSPTYIARGLPLHGLISNAGIMAPPFTLSQDACCPSPSYHSSPSRIETSGPSRVVVLSSILHSGAPKEGIAFDKINDAKTYNGQSKLANILFAKELNAQLQSRGIQNVYVNSVHPGVIDTGLWRHLKSSIVIRMLLPLFYESCDIIKGSSTSLSLATDNEIVEKDYKGEYFVFIVTGGNMGLGRVTSTELARKGAHVILACRNEEKTLPVVSEIQKETNNTKVEFMKMDLLSLKSVDEFAKGFMSRGLPLHGLICNAGIMASPFTLSQDGIESQFATNHVAHHLLTTRLLPVLESSGPSRVVVLSSILHRDAPKEGILFDKINDPKAYKPFTAYGQSKLANILFAKELNTRLQERGVQNVYVNSVHPGVIDTGLWRHLDSSIFVKMFLRVFYALYPEVVSIEKGSSTSLYLATDNEIIEKNYKGEYFIPVAKLSKPTTPAGNDMELAKRLWEYTETLIAEKLAA